MKIIGTMRALDETNGVVRIEDVYDTDIDDLWRACTEPARLARWVADVSGDLRLGGEFDAIFTSGWEGSGRIDACDPPHRLRVSTWERDSTEADVIEITLTPDGDRTTLVIENRGVPIGQIAEHGAGWQIHAEDLAAHLAGRERSDMETRWNELLATYRLLTVG